MAAFVVEPVGGATLGTVPPVAGYLARIREICDRHGVLLIADEVMCGMGRCGDWFVCTQEGVAPDIITIAKGLGEGLQPIAAMMASERVVRAIEEGSGLLAHGHIYMSHAVACAASLAVIRTIEDKALLEAVRARGDLLSRRLHEAFGQHPHVGDIRGRGLFQTPELMADRETKRPYEAGHRLAAHIKSTAQEMGLICYPTSGSADGIRGDHVLLAPPFIVTEAQVEEIVAKLGQAIAVCLPQGNA